MKTTSKIKKDQILLSNIKKNLNELKNLSLDCSDHWAQEDCIYRFYHQSFKVYRIQSYTQKIVEKLIFLMPDEKINPWFLEIYNNGTNKNFNLKVNNNWVAETKPLLEAYFHAKMFLDMAIKYGEELDHPPEILPSGWALLLYFYNIR